MKPIYLLIFIHFFIISCSKPIVKEQTTPQAEIKETPISSIEAKPQTPPIIKAPVKKPPEVHKPIKKTRTPTPVKKKTNSKPIPKMTVDPVIDQQSVSTTINEQKSITDIETSSPLPKPELMTITEDKLPISFGSSWTLDKKPDHLTHQLQCVLSSSQKKFHDGYDNAKMSIQITSTALIIKTDSEIDLTYPNVGIDIDNNSAFLFEKVFNKSYTLHTKKLSTLQSLMTKGHTINIKLGFWPTWPQTKTSSVGFSLHSFDKALAALKACK